MTTELKEAQLKLLVAKDELRAVVKTMTRPEIDKAIDFHEHHLELLENELYERNEREHVHGEGDEDD